MIWIDEICEEAGTDNKGVGYKILRASLLALRNRLTQNEAIHLGDQLPMLIRGIYYEGWSPSESPSKIRDKDEFIKQVNGFLRTELPFDTEKGVRSVFKVMRKHVTEGEIKDVQDILPSEIKPLISFCGG